MATPNESAVGPIRTALVAALRGTATSSAAQAAAAVALQAYLHERPATAPDAFRRVFAQRAVPGNLVGRWVAIGGPGERWARTFNQGGAEGDCTLHLWHTPVQGDDVGDAVTVEVWRLVALVLSYPLDLAGHRMLFGVPSLVTLLPDPDERTWHGVVTYATRTQPEPVP